MQNSHEPDMRLLVTAEATHRVEALHPDLFEQMRLDRAFLVSMWDEEEADIVALIARCELGGARLERSMPWMHPAVGLVTTLLFTTNRASADRVMARLAGKLSAFRGF